LHHLVSRHDENPRKLAAGVAIRKKGRPAEDSVVSEEDKISGLRCKLTRKEIRITQSKIENERMHGNPHL